MSVSSFLGTRIATILPSSSSIQFNNSRKLQAATVAIPPIECSSRPQKKATAHHRKTRPKKTQPWDIKRRPTVYAPFPPLPADFTVVSSGADADAEEQAESSSSSSSVVAENSDSA